MTNAAPPWMHCEVLPLPTLPKITRTRLLGQRLNCLIIVMRKRKNTAAAAATRRAGQR